MDEIIQPKAKKFALRVIKLNKYLVEQKKEYVMSNQILWSATSIGANIVEAQCGFSEKDFLAKMYIAYKESAETLYWLDLLYESKNISEIQYNSLYEDCNEIKNILSSITKTLREKINLRNSESEE